MPQRSQHFGGALTCQKRPVRSENLERSIIHKSIASLIAQAYHTRTSGQRGAHSCVVLSGRQNVVDCSGQQIRAQKPVFPDKIGGLGIASIGDALHCRIHRPDRQLNRNHPETLAVAVENRRGHEGRRRIGTRRIGRKVAKGRPIHRQSHRVTEHRGKFGRFPRPVPQTGREIALLEHGVDNVPRGIDQEDVVETALGEPLRKSGMQVGMNRIISAAIPRRHQQIFLTQRIGILIDIGLLQPRLRIGQGGITLGHRDQRTLDGMIPRHRQKVCARSVEQETKGLFRPAAERVERFLGARYQRIAGDEIGRHGST